MLERNSSNKCYYSDDDKKLEVSQVARRPISHRAAGAAGGLWGSSRKGLEEDRGVRDESGSVSV